MSTVRFSSVWGKLWILMFATAGLYFVTARLGLALAMPPAKKATAVWAPSGIALAALLIAGKRAWPAVWLGAFLANLWDMIEPAGISAVRTHLAVSFGIATGSTMQALLGATLFRRFVGDNNLLNRSRSAFGFAAMTPLVCIVAATVGVTVLVLTGVAPWSSYGFHWWTWWLGDAVGMLVVTPLILVWSASPFGLKGGTRRLLEAALVVLLMLAVAACVFGGLKPWGVVAGSLAYLMVPLLVWVTFRFGQHGATAGLTLVAGIAVLGTVHGDGPFVYKTLNESLLFLQTFIGVLAMTVLFLAAVLSERQQAEDAKAALIEQVERALSEVRTLRGLIPICAWCKNIRTDAGSWEQLEAYLREHTEAEFSHSICPDCLHKSIGHEISLEG